MFFVFFPSEIPSHASVHLLDGGSLFVRRRGGRPGVLAAGVAVEAFEEWLAHHLQVAVPALQLRGVRVAGRLHPGDGLTAAGGYHAHFQLGRTGGERASCRAETGNENYTLPETKYSKCTVRNGQFNEVFGQEGEEERT